MAFRAAILHAGTYYHEVSIRACTDFAQVYRLPEALPDPDEHPILIIPDRTNPRWLADRNEHWLKWTTQGRVLFVCAESNTQEWLPDAGYKSHPTNFWYWLEGKKLDIRTANTQHPFWKFLRVESLHWHYHATFQPNPETDVPLAFLHDDDGQNMGALLMERRTKDGGKIIFSGLDPHYHHGSYFMPNASLFLEDIYNYLRHLAGTY